MKNDLQTSIVEQLDALISEYNQLRSKSKHNDLSDVLKGPIAYQMQTRCLASIERAAGTNSVYYKQAESILNLETFPSIHVSSLIGVAESLSLDIKAGYLKTVEELIHGDIFGDFLEMADHLISSGYKDAAAVIAGSTLEAHLRKLCDKAAIETQQNGRPKNADLINSELVKSKIYTPLDHKNVTAWLGLRNNAAHGNYDAYERQQVNLMIASIRDFITRHPA